MHKEGNAALIAERVGALILNGHFRYASGMHGAAYFEKRRLFRDPRDTMVLANDIALYFRRAEIEAVLAPAYGAIMLGNFLAYMLTTFLPGGGFVPCVIAEKDDHENFRIPAHSIDLLAGKRTLAVDDVFTTGGSTRKVVQEAVSIGAELVAVAGIVNRGGVQASDVGLNEGGELFTLLKLDLPVYSPDNCPLCASGVPINTKLGRGKAFRATQGGAE